MDNQGDPRLKYPFKEMSQDERRAWLEHQRDRWNARAATLGRIKQDEQRWVLVAIAVYSAIITFLGVQGTALFGGGAGGAAVEPCAWQRFAALLLMLSLTHGFALVWTAHALTLRVQYYRSMCRMFDAQLALGGRVPSRWLTTCWQSWRRRATAPEDSKYAEMRLLAFLTLAVTGLVAFYAFNGLGAAGGARCYHLGLAVPPVCVSVVLGFLWPGVFYGRRDKKNMKQLYCERVRKLQCKGKRRAKGESVGCDE